MRPPRDLVVCIPTCRRPAQLAALLRALADQSGAPPFDVVVGNNEVRDVRTYAELAAPPLPFDVVQVAERGVSAVRNATIAAVLARPSVTRWIACIDDDQTPRPDWLARLVTTGVSHDADLVGGPVARIAAARTFWSEAASDTSYLPRRTGPVAMLNEAGNLLLATRWLRTLGREPFLLAFGRSGGEDYEFFLFARSRGARMVWADDARVEEPLRADRLTFAGYVSRYYTIAAYQTRADRRYQGLGHVARTIAREAVRGPIATTAALLHEHRAKRTLLEGIRFAAAIAGRVAGLFGARTEKYGRD